MAWPLFHSRTRPASIREQTTPPSTSSISRSATASSWSWSDRPAAASPPRSGCSRAWRRSTPAAIFIGDRDVTDLPPKDRDIAMVFQNYALYPHMTVGDNMGFALKMAGVSQDGAPAARPGGRSPARPGGLPQPQAEGALRRPAAACRHGPRHRPRTPGLLDGRAAVQPRRQAARLRPAPRSPRCRPASASPPST